MTLLRIQPDTEWGISESHLRMPPIASDTPELMWGAAVWPLLEQAIPRMERLRKWRMLESVPVQKHFFGGGAFCCEKMLKPAGTPVPVILRPSDYQGDTRDAPNADKVVEASVVGDAKGDLYLTAIVHFWQPGVLFNRTEFLESLPTEKSRFVSPERLPAPILEAVGHVYGTNLRDRSRN